MPRATVFALALATMALSWCAPLVTLAQVTSDQVLPDSTVGCVSVPNVNLLAEAWSKTELSQLFEDPAMKKFGEDLRRQLTKKWSQTHQRLGLQPEDLDGVAGGELCLALVRTSEGKAAIVVLADVSANPTPAHNLLEKVTRTLLGQKAKQSQQTRAGASITLFDVPGRGDRVPARQVAYSLQQGWLCIGDHLGVVADVLEHFKKPGLHALASQPVYQAVMDRCRSSAGELAPHVKWYVDPFGAARALRASEAMPRDHNPDWLKILTNQKLTGVQGLGGFVNFAVGPYGLLHRTAVHAPPPHELAMRILSFPNSSDFAPQPWVPSGIVTYTSFHWDMQNAFEMFGTLFDEIYGEAGVWEDTVQSLAKDPVRPIDLRQDLIAHLGSRGTVVRDYKLPITPTSERRLLAVEVRNPEELARVISRAMEGDPSATKRDVHGIDVWEVTAEEEESSDDDSIDPSADVNLDEIDVTEGLDDEDDEALGGGVGLPTSAVAVVHGHLLVASHLDLLEKVLGEIDEQDRLENDVEFRLVQSAMEKLGATQNCARSFSRSDEDYRITYELFRQGKLPEADTLLAKLLNTLLGEEKEGVVRKPSLDGSKLPEYSVVKRYLGPAGAFVTSEENGWLIIGFSLSKSTDVAGGANESDATR